MFKFVSCLVIILEFLYSKFAVSWKNSIFNPPYHAGNDYSIFSLSEQIWPPVIAGMNFYRIVCSNGSSNSLLGMMQMKYVSLHIKPLTNVTCVDCGLVSAIFDKSCSWLFKLVGSSRMPCDVKLTLVFPKTTFAFSKYLIFTMRWDFDAFR